MQKIKFISIIKNERLFQQAEKNYKKKILQAGSVIANLTVPKNFENGIIELKNSLEIQ